MTIYNPLFLFIRLYDFVWLWMTLHDHVWLSMNLYDYMWLYDFIWLCMICITLYDYASMHNIILCKNVQNQFSRCFGSREMSKTKAGTFWNTLHYIGTTAIANLKKVDFLDVTFTLDNDEYKPHNKPKCSCKLRCSSFSS